MSDAKKKNSLSRPPAQAPAVEPRGAFAFSSGTWIKVLVVLQLVVLAVEFSPDISTNGDDAKYYLLGKSLLSGNGYRDLFDSHNPVHTQYPPLFPAFLGITGAVTNSPLIPKIALGMLCAGILLLMVSYVRTHKRNLLLPFACLVAVSASLASQGTLLLSEIPYLFTTAAALVLLELSVRRGGMGFIFWAAALAAVLPAFIRSAGIAFTLAWVAAAIVDKRYKQAIAFIVLFAGAMIIVPLVTGCHSSYIEPLLRKNSYDPELGFVTPYDMLQRIGQNIQIYVSTVLPRTMLGPGVSLQGGGAFGVSLLFLVPAGIGWVRNFVLPSRIVSFYMMFYAGILCMWQVEWSGERFLIPVIPFLVFLFLLGIETTLSFLRKKASRVSNVNKGIIWAVVLVVVIFNCIDHVRQIQGNTALSADWKNFYSCADWIRLNTPNDAVVVSRKPELFYLRSLRKGFIYPYSHDGEKIMSAIKEGGARYCILDNFYWTGTTARYLYPVVTSHADRFHIVYSLHNPETYVLEIVP